jgi:hypothetical protein
VDTETTVDSTQTLLFGAFRYCRVDDAAVITVAEGLIYADDLPDTDPDGYRVLQEYAKTQKPDANLTYPNVEPSWQLQLVSRKDFVDKWLWHVGYPHNNRLDPATIVMFNAPFDISRLAVDVAEARADMRGGFSFTLWTDNDSNPAPWRPRIAIKTIDSKRAIKKFRRLERGKNNHSGHLLDLRTLVFALTGTSHSLDSACAASHVPGKASAPEFGVISDEAIDYCRQDVHATTALYTAAMDEYRRHPTELQATKAYSPASIAKAYLHAMGIQSRLELQPDFPTDILGFAMSAFYGGRSEIHIRRTPVPVTLVDFTSMYPTVDILMRIWDLVTANEIKAVDHTDGIRKLLDDTRLDDWFEPNRWPQLVAIVEIIPDGDIVPVRANYRPDDWSIGLNPLYSDQSFWYTLPDIIASKLLSGRTPQIRRALRFIPTGGTQNSLQDVALRSDVLIDPRDHDFFQRVVEARQEAKDQNPNHPHETCTCQPCGTARFLKVLANAGNYGIYAEMIRREQPGKVTVHSSSGEPFIAHVTAPEWPGRYCFPPIAACITGAARLMLTLLERSIIDSGGTWVFCDTDSMAIVATPTGDELIACHHSPDGTDAIRTLSYNTVEAIRGHFNQLNPYDPQLVPDLLKVEADGTCLAISAKRYVLYNQTPLGDIDIVKRSEHGLGRYLPPRTMPPGEVDENKPTTWVDECWRWIIKAIDNPDEPLPTWVDELALTRITVSSPILARPFTRWNKGKSWGDRIKPFNFLLVADLDPFGLPLGADPHRFRLIAAYNSAHDGRDLEWRNLYDPDGVAHEVTTDRLVPPHPNLALIKSYGQILREYSLHPEYKFHGPGGEPCARDTRGLMRRRTVRAVGTQHIGKEANRLDDVRAGVISDLSEVVTTYGGTDQWRDLVLCVLRRYSGRELAALVGADRRTIDRIRMGQKPRPDLAWRLQQIAVGRASSELTSDALVTGKPIEEGVLLLSPLIAAGWAPRPDSHMRPGPEVGDD